MPSVGRVLTGRVVEVLRADDPLNTLLFSVRPAVSVLDSRVYASTAELPEGPIREVLPRVLIHIIEAPLDVEQPSVDGEKPAGVCVVYTHVLAEADEEDLAQRIDDRVRVVLTSTSLSDARIIASGLVPTGVRAPERETAFRNAWRLTREYRAQAGVL